VRSRMVLESYLEPGLWFRVESGPVMCEIVDLDRYNGKPHTLIKSSAQ